LGRSGYSMPFFPGTGKLSLPNYFKKISLLQLHSILKKKYYGGNILAF
jgi:hypothetical protein